MAGKMIKILYLSLNPNLHGPLPKIEPLLTAALEKNDCQVRRSSWGRHSEHETMAQKIFGRLGDIRDALVKLVGWRPDILFVATTLDEAALVRDIPLLLATCWLPVKKVMMMHGSKSGLLVEPGHGLFKLLTGLLVRLSDAILLLSNDEMKEWTDFDSHGHYYRVENPFIPPNPDLTCDAVSQFHQSSRPNLLFVGRLTRDKGIYELLDSMSVILQEINCQLLIAGDGEEKNQILQLIESRHLEQSINLLGYLDSTQLDRVYKVSSIFILPSYREGFPAVITEAMSYGLPIITTPIRGICDHLPDDVNAVYIQPKDSDAIADAVLRLLKNPTWREEMCQANFAKVQEFRPENVVPGYIQVFNQLLGLDSQSAQLN
jgi:glycosyltransferase involved in cell wall biosynthesis